MTIRRTILSLAAALAVAAVVPASAPAIVNGVPDGNGHPAVGLLTYGPEHGLGCTVWYVGPRKGDPSTSVLVTAGHCVADQAAAGAPPSELSVTFAPAISVDEETWGVTAPGWRTVVGYAHSDVDDYGVVLLDGGVAAPPVQLPVARRLDTLAARGALRPETVFDNVGYGATATFKRAPAQLAFPTGRMVSTSKFAGLTRSRMHLLGVSDAGYGGACYFDSGAPVLEHGTNRAVALVSGGGDPNCRNQHHGLRMDVPAARAFYGPYVQLP
jgi:hypothetical protein